LLITGSFQGAIQRAPSPNQQSQIINPKSSIPNPQLTRRCGELLIVECRLIIVDYRSLSKSHSASAFPNQQSKIINSQSSIPNNPPTNPIAYPV
jgi:hypothetical protein